MARLRVVGEEFQRSPCKDADTSKSFSTSIRGSASTARPLIFKILSLYEFCIRLTLYATYLLGTISTASNSSISATSFYFNVESTSYNCSTNLICLGQAHVNVRNEFSGIQVGMLSLVTEDLYSIVDGAGVAYYNTPVRLLDYSTGHSASFNTSFRTEIRVNRGVNNNIGTGDGMTFVMSESNDTLGGIGNELGVFQNGTTSFKTIVVEFDSYQNAVPPFYDISNNHVSFDFSNITTPAAANASDVNVLLWSNLTIYTWVEYSNVTQRLEVRVSNNETRPIDPLLNYTVNLFDVAAEYMWVGFSGANSGDAGDPFDPWWVSNYYVGDWAFKSYGIASSVSSNKKAGETTGFIVGISVGGGGLLVTSIFLVYWVKRRRSSRRQRFSEKDVLQLDGMPERFSYEELSVATTNFSEESKLGQGGFGSVYRGVLPSGVQVAVKKINSNSTQGEKEFLAEVSIINQSRHRNLIELRGWCKDGSIRQYMLVYELMSNGSLDKWLFAPAEEEATGLSWSQRLNIVKGIALAVDYLHQGCVRQVIHRDIKSSNIMLDEKFNVKLGDFGLSRLVDRQGSTPTEFLDGSSLNYVVPEAYSGKFTLLQTTVQTTRLAGTPGYMAPEALLSSKCTDKTDVYAFGIVLLEIVCGRQAYKRRDVPSEETFLVNWVWDKMTGGELSTVVDRRLIGEYDPSWIEVTLHVGLLCAHDDPESRPSMGLVVRMLDGDVPVPPIPPRTSAHQPRTINDLFYRSCSDISNSIPRLTIQLTSSSNFSHSTRASTVTSPIFESSDSESRRFAT